MERRRIGTDALLGLALALFLVPIGWIVAWMLAVVTHEAFHYLAIRLCGGRVSSIHVGAAGIRMEVWGLGYWQELICALAGPLGGLLLLYVAEWMPRTALCALIQSAFNLLPVYPLDGGRALWCCIGAVFPKAVAGHIRNMIQAFASVFVVLLGIHMTFGAGAGVVPLIGALVLAYRWFPGKRPCNSAVFSIQ